MLFCEKFILAYFALGIFALLRSKEWRVPKIKYLANDVELEIVVSDEFYKSIKQYDHRDFLVNRKETRRHQSLNKSLEKGFMFIDPRIDVEKEVICKMEFERLHLAILKLLPSQQQLVYRVYFNDEKMVDIAKEEGVADSSVRHRMARALKMLKKYLE